MSKQHLNVIQTQEDGNYQTLSLGNPNRVEFVWTNCERAFQVHPLKWWDDASYAACLVDMVEDHEPETPPSFVEIQQQVLDLAERERGDCGYWEVGLYARKMWA